MGHGHSHGGHGHKPKTRSVSRSPIINSSSEDNTPSDSSIPPPVTANGTAAATSPEDVGVSMITEGVDEEDVFVANGKEPFHTHQREGIDNWAVGVVCVGLLCTV